MTDGATDAALVEWGDTWFGDPSDWSPALVAAGKNCLSCPEPAAVAWGPDFRLLYNRAYADLLGGQHPAVRGRPAWEPAAAMWDVVGPMLHHVRVTGEVLRGERTALPLDTAEGRRTHWYSWSYSAITDGDEVAGVLALVCDETADELAAAHGRARAGAARVASAQDVASALREFVTVLASLPDVRVAVVHRLGPGGRWTRVAHGGPELRGPIAASLLDHAEATGRWPTTPACAAPAPLVVRAPAPESRGLWNSWSAVATVRGDVVAITVGFAPLVGNAADHRPFVTALIQTLGASLQGV